MTEIKHSKYWYDYNRNDPDRENPFTEVTDLGIETPLDKLDEVREYFDDSEWDAIYDSLLAESALAPEEQEQLLLTTASKIRVLFDITGEIDR